MTKFAQHVRIRAAAGARDALAAKFVETLAFLDANPACELTLVSTAPDDPDVVLLTEIWTSKADHEAAVRTPEVAAWAASMPELTDGPPEIQRLEPVDWKAMPRTAARS